jgi:GMP synthase-like glutamine amidotransferase
MTLHILQHVEFEGPGHVADWASSRGVPLRVVRLYAGDALPEIAAGDGIVAMGGPMSVNDGSLHPWIGPEIALLRDASDRDIPLLGICLGAQLIASALGASVAAGEHREIGWFPVIPDPRSGSWAALLDEDMPVFHWHGETFALPDGSRRLASSPGCDNQGFVRGRSVGLQFHLETTPGIAADLIDACRDEMTEGPWIQTPEQILGNHAAFAGIHACLDRLLDALFADLRHA